MTTFSSNRLLSLATLRLPKHRLAGILFCVGVLSGIASVAVPDDPPVPSVVFDSDVDFDDTVVLAALAPASDWVAVKLPKPLRRKS